jgi:hypothetical protein
MVMGFYRWLSPKSYGLLWWKRRTKLPIIDKIRPHFAQLATIIRPRNNLQTKYYSNQTTQEETPKQLNKLWFCFIYYWKLGWYVTFNNRHHINQDRQIALKKRSQNIWRINTARSFDVVDYPTCQKLFDHQLWNYITYKYFLINYGTPIVQYLSKE